MPRYDESERADLAPTLARGLPPPWGEGDTCPVVAKSCGAPICRKMGFGAPSPRGWGEGERGARFHRTWVPHARPSDFGLRPSFGLRLSDFGFLSHAAIMSLHGS
jgi:hypothetical protein